MITEAPPRREIVARLLLSRRSRRVFELHSCLVTVARLLLILRWPWSSGVAAMRVWGPRPRPGLLSASGLLLCPENTAAGWSRPRPRWSAQYLIYSAIPPFLPGPPPPCTSPSYESEKGRLTLGGRQPAAGSTGQVSPPGGASCSKHLAQTHAAAAPAGRSSSRRRDPRVPGT